jgi:rubredoxin
MKIIRKKMSQYVCLDCGWIYDEAVGYAEGSIPAGTKWEAIPESFKCPECETLKSDTHMWQKID